MKIVIISSTLDEADIVQRVLSSFSGSDQITSLGRIDSALHLDRIDLASTDVVVIDVETVQDSDIRALSTIAHHSTVAPAFIYLSQTTTHDQLLQLIRVGVSDVLHHPIEVNQCREAIDRIRVKRASLGKGTQSKVISFLSGKGGAGATFLATNLGYILSVEMGKKVLFADLHMQGGDASFYLTNLTGNSNIADIAKSGELDSMMIASAAIPVEPNYLLLQSPDSPEKAAGLTASHIDNLINVAIQHYDYVILDLPHILDAVTIKALDRSDAIFVVTQPIMTYLRAVSHMLHLFSRLDYEPSKVRVLLNRMDNVGVLSVAKVEDSIQKNINVSIPNDFLNAVEAVNLGVPIVESAPNSAISEALRGIALSLTGGEVPEVENKKSMFKRMFKK